MPNTSRPDFAARPRGRAAADQHRVRGHSREHVECAAGPSGGARHSRLDCAADPSRHASGYAARQDRGRTAGFRDYPGWSRGARRALGSARTRAPRAFEIGRRVHVEGGGGKASRARYLRGQMPHQRFQADVARDAERARIQPARKNERRGRLSDRSPASRRRAALHRATARSAARCRAARGRAGRRARTVRRPRSGPWRNPRRTELDRPVAALRIFGESSPMRRAARRAGATARARHHHDDRRRRMTARAPAAVGRSDSRPRTRASVFGLPSRAENPAASTTMSRRGAISRVRNSLSCRHDHARQPATQALLGTHRRGRGVRSGRPRS